MCALLRCAETIWYLTGYTVSTMVIFFFAVLGAILGSFAGAVSERLYTGQSWFSGRSTCNACGTGLHIPDLIPVVSWLLSWGHCRYCTAKFPVRYLGIELLMALLFVGAYLSIGVAPALPFFLAALVVLAITVLYDMRHTVIPHPLSILLGMLAFTTFVVMPMDMGTRGLVLLSAGLYGLAFFALHMLSRGRAMGLADTPLVMSLTLLAGTQAFAGLMLSFWIGAVIGIIILVRAPKGRRMGIEVPFAPFLAAGFLLATLTSWDPLSLITSLVESILIP